MKKSKEFSFEAYHRQTMVDICKKFTSTYQLRIFGEDRSYYTAKHGYYLCKSRNAKKKKDQKRYENIAMEALHFNIFDLE